MTTIEHRTFTDPDLEIRAAAKGGDGRTVEGIAVPYNRTQRIDSTLTERFAPGAFAHQIGAAFRIPVAREHVSLGGTVIGRVVEARDDARGLWVSMRVSATPAGEETLTLLRDGVLDELSIGFRARRHRTLPDGVIERTRADLTEVSVVLAGAYGRHAAVSGVRTDEDADDDEARSELDGRTRAERAKVLLAGVPLLSAAVLID